MFLKCQRSASLILDIHNKNAYQGVTLYQLLMIPCMTNHHDTQHYPFVDYIYWLKRLDNQINKPTNQNLIKVPKSVKPTNKKTLL